jgi:myo-inositol catabolism protein IolS
MIDSLAGLGLGCWQFGDMGAGTPPPEEAVGLIREAFQLGITHFDTAQDYGNGRSETVLGQAIRPFSGEAFISSKMHACGFPETLDGVARSLKRLQRDFIDLFYVHWPRTGLDIRPMIEALETLRARGALRYIGVSNFSVPDLESAASAGRIDACPYPSSRTAPWPRDCSPILRAGRTALRKGTRGGTPCTTVPTSGRV